MHLNLDRAAGMRPHDYVCAHDDATILNRRNLAPWAAVVLWLMFNPGPLPLDLPRSRR